MNTHPEQKAHEIFVGNTAGVALPNHLAAMTTARIGEQAYTLSGEQKIPQGQMRPLFIGRSEAGMYDAIMMARFSAACRGR